MDRSRDEVENEEQLDAVGEVPCEAEIDARHEMFLVLPVILDALQRDEGKPEADRGGKQPSGQPARFRREDLDRPGDQEAGGEQDRGVRRSDHDLGVPAPRGKALRIGVPGAS
ncbi:hypothetical protein [Bradyrhizobium tropiciagri]|uniref:hypothetical protein n=1 Tax=Bradyrhizobium tropiciagri TaxID=312253 RepID=UPI00138F0EB0|nr:hypothetical protein [Bradyrhizobium tropiciagri]